MLVKQSNNGATVHIGIFERDEQGNKTPVNVATWTKLSDCLWHEVPTVFGKIPVGFQLIRPKPKMVSDEGMTMAIADKPTEQWANVTFDQFFVADYFRKEILERAFTSSDISQLQTAKVKINEWIDWIAEKDSRQVRQQIDTEIKRIQEEYASVNGRTLSREEALAALAVVQPALARDGLLVEKLTDK